MLLNGGKIMAKQEVEPALWKTILSEEKTKEAVAWHKKEWKGKGRNTQPQMMEMRS